MIANRNHEIIFTYSFYIKENLQHHMNIHILQPSVCMEAGK